MKRLASVLFGAACVLLSAAPNDAGAQTKLRGKRDISGLWTAFPFSLGLDPTVAFGQPQKVSLTPEYEARYKASLSAKMKAEAAGTPIVDGVTLCIPVGMPGSMGAVFPMDIIPTAKVIYILIEGLDPPRRIFMDGRKIPGPDDLEPTFGGFSVGRWEGDTLVVETAGVKTSTVIEGVPHSDAMRVTERFRLIDDDTLSNEITITDPKAFKAPWVIKKQYKDHALVAHPGAHPDHKGAELEANEYVCNENNRNVPDSNGLVGATLNGK